MFPESHESITPHANATPSEDAPALEAPTPEPSLQPGHTSNVAAADTSLSFAPSTSAILGGVGAQVVDTKEDVKAVETQSQDVDEKEREKAITTGQAHLSLLRIRENSLHFVAFTERTTSQAGIVNNSGNTTSVVGDGAVITNNNSIKIVQAPDEQVCHVVKAANILLIFCPGEAICCPEEGSRANLCRWDATLS